ncbi:MAG: HDOD domain-containing protein [Planctomycetota bacterium]|nr:HDOD domain-containing protein [Planctomycetota bacterium]
MKDAEELVKDIIDLPTLPQVITTLMSLLDDPKSSVRDINNVIGKDPALVAKILKLVNSAFYAIPTRISSISQAIAILGFRTVKSIVVSASIIGMFDSDNEDFSYKEFWVNSLGVATISRFIILRLSEDPLSGCGAIHPDTGFVSGLLNGIGKMVLDQYAHEDFMKILNLAKEGQVSFHEAESKVFQGGHSAIGFWLAKNWNLSEEVQMAIRYQDSVEECPPEVRSMTAVLALAKYLCRLRQYGSSGDFDNKPAPPKAAVHVLAITKDTLPTLTQGLAAEFEKAGAFLTMVRS